MHGIYDFEPRFDQAIPRVDCIGCISDFVKASDLKFRHLGGLRKRPSELWEIRTSECPDSPNVRVTKHGKKSSRHRTRLNPPLIRRCVGPHEITYLRTGRGQQDINRIYLITMG